MEQSQEALFPYRQAVRVNIEQLEQVVVSVVRELIADIQGPENGIEDETTYGLERVRLATYAALEQARQQGQKVVQDVSYCDGIQVPLVAALSDEPAWYLTITLNARVQS